MLVISHWILLGLICGEIDQHTYCSGYIEYSYQSHSFCPRLGEIAITVIVPIQDIWIWLLTPLVLSRTCGDNYQSHRYCLEHVELTIYTTVTTQNMWRSPSKPLLLFRVDGGQEIIRNIYVFMHILRIFGDSHQGNFFCSEYVDLFNQNHIFSSEYVDFLYQSHCRCSGHIKRGSKHYYHSRYG